MTESTAPTTIDTTQKRVFNSHQHRLLLTRQGLTVLETSQEVLLWSQPWPRLRNISLSGANLILEGEDDNFIQSVDSSQGQGFNASPQYILDTLNAYMQAHRQTAPESSTHANATRNEPDEDSRNTIVNPIVAFSVLLFFISLGVVDTIASTINSFTPATQPYASLKHTFQAFFYVLLAIGAIKLLIFTIKRHDSRESSTASNTIFLGMIGLFAAALCIKIECTLLPRIILKYEHDKSNFYFEENDLVQDKIYRKFKSSKTYEIVVGGDGKQSLRFDVSSDAYNQASVGFPVHITGRKSQYGTVVDGWTVLTSVPPARLTL